MLLISHIDFDFDFDLHSFYMFITIQKIAIPKFTSLAFLSIT